MNKVNEEIDGLQGAADVPGTPGEGDAESASEDSAATLGSIGYLRFFSSLCLVLALIVFVGYLARKLLRRAPLLAGGQLGSVLGRIPLSRGASLHFVRSGGRVLVIGVTATNTSLVAEFDASAFPGEGEVEEAALPEEAHDPKDFRAQLRASSESMTQEQAQPVADDEIDSLRGDIERLQKHFREESRDH